MYFLYLAHKLNEPSRAGILSRTELARYPALVALLAGHLVQSFFMAFLGMVIITISNVTKIFPMFTTSSRSVSCAFNYAI